MSDIEEKVDVAVSQLTKKRFCVVQFESDSAIEVMPTIWLLTETEAKWPSHLLQSSSTTSSSVIFHQYITKCRPATDEWATLTVNIINYSNSFKRASSKAERLLETSAVSSDSPDEIIEVGRKRKRPARYSSDELEILSDEENESQSLISNKKYPIPKFPGSRKLPKKNLKTRTISHKAGSRVSSKDSNESVSYAETSSQATENRNANQRDDTTQSTLCSQTFLQSRGSASIHKDTSASATYSQTVLQDVENKPSIHKDQYALFQRMFKYMEILNSKVNNLNEKVDKLMARNATSSSEATPLDFLPSDVQLPLTTEDELRHFNERIKGDRELSAVMVRYLHGAANGKTACSFILSITKRLLSAELAQKYSRFGRKGKRSFLPFNETLTVILAAGAMRFKDLDKEKLSDFFGKALAGASEWNGRASRARSSDPAIEDISLSLYTHE